MLGALAIILLILMVIFGVTLIVGSKFKQKICQQEGGTYTTTCSTLTLAYNATVDLIEEIVSVITWVGILVLLAIGGTILVIAKSFMKDNKGGI